MTKLDLEAIRRFWTEQAQVHGQQPSASWSDTFALQLEAKELLNYLDDGDSVLDVGCANGFTTVNLATGRNLRILGLDYIPEMVEQAKARLDHLDPALAGRIHFAFGNIMDLPPELGTFDKVVVVRVLINLESWENQALALQNCAQRVRPGGLLLLSEATLQGWGRMNSFRREWGLDPIPIPPFNTYLDQDQVIEATYRDFDLVAVSDFASTYFVGTRVLKPLLVKALGTGFDSAVPGMEWNRWFSQLPAAGDYGTQKLFVLRRK